MTLLSNSSPLIAVLRFDSAITYEPVTEILLAAGIVNIETTLTTPGTTDELARLVSTFPDACIGVGTVLTEYQAETAIGQGAHFIVSPHFSSHVDVSCRNHEVPFLPGAFSPKEVHDAAADGRNVVKLFPAHTVGPDYLHLLAGPYPDVRIAPSGGIELDDVAGWLKAGAWAVSVGGSLTRDVERTGDLRSLADRARRVVDAAQGARL